MPHHSLWLECGPHPFHGFIYPPSYTWLIGFQVGHFPLKTLKALIQILLTFKDTVEKSDAILISDSLYMIWVPTPRPPLSLKAFKVFILDDLKSHSYISLYGSVSFIFLEINGGFFWSRNSFPLDTRNFLLWFLY